MVSKMNLIKVLSGAMTLTVFVGCTTFGGGKIGRESSISDDPIVMAAGVEQPILAKLDRDEWIEIRKSNISEEQRLYTALGTRDYAVAEQEARAYLQRKPKNRSALVVLATTSAMQRNYDSALYYGKLVQKYYGDYESDLLNIKGLAVLYKAKPTYADFSAAAINFKSSFDGSSKQIAAGFNLGHLQLMMGNANLARDTFQTVESRCNGCVEAKIGYGVALVKLRSYVKARDVFKDILDQSPANPIALYRLALIEKNGFNNPNGAIDYLGKILADTTNNHLEMKRQASTLLNRMQASEVGREMAADSRRDETKDEPVIVPVSYSQKDSSEIE